MKTPKQCAILVGGLGTRLGKLTKETPKPLLPCGGRPFLAWVLRELSRYGFDDIVLLAGYKSECVDAFCRDVHDFVPKKMSIRISVEPEPAGTGGALKYASAFLDDTFLMINGDSWVDTNLVNFLAAASASHPDTLGYMLARKMEDCSRYGTLSLNGDVVTGFREKQFTVGSGVINGGIYVLNKKILELIDSTCSLEQVVLPALASGGHLKACVVNGYFIDIGIPTDYARAQSELPARFLRPAVFFDRDGVLNEDYGWVGHKDNFRWVDGAKDAIAAVNSAGYHTFIVTNQAGVAKGLYDEKSVCDLHNFLCDDLRVSGFFIDDIRYCPFHPEAKIERYRISSNWRKPAPGMLQDLARAWQIDMKHSFLIGDKNSDIEAAAAAGIPGHLFCGGNLYAFLRPLLRDRDI